MNVTMRTFTQSSDGAAAPSSGRTATEYTWQQFPLTGWIYFQKHNPAVQIHSAGEGLCAPEARHLTDRAIGEDKESKLCSPSLRCNRHPCYMNTGSNTLCEPCGNFPIDTGRQRSAPGRGRSGGSGGGASPGGSSRGRGGWTRAAWTPAPRGRRGWRRGTSPAPLPPATPSPLCDREQSNFIPESIEKYHIVHAAWSSAWPAVSPLPCII